MAITSFNTNYSGRTRDINILKVKSYTNNQTQTATIGFGNPSQYISGVEKLVQRYAILFLTNLGSQINYPTFGTNFLTALQENPSNISSLQAQHLFNYSNNVVISIFTTYQANNPGLPLDEQFSSAQLVGFASNGTTVNMSIAITSLSGSNVEFILPLPISANN